MIETKPLELIYQGPTQVSQVLSPFSASPPSVLLSGFRSRCHIVIKGAFPSLRVQQGLSQLIRLYTRAGFPNEELQAISNQLLIQHQNSSLLFSKIASAAFGMGCSFLCVPVVASSFLFPGFFLSLLVVVVFLWSLASLLQLPGSSFAFLLLRRSFERSWIMLKDERSIIIWLELLCISTIWQGSCLSSSPPLNMMKRRLRPISVLIIQQPEACTLLCLVRHPKVLRPWYHMAASLPTWY